MATNHKGCNGAPFYYLVGNFLQDLQASAGTEAHPTVVLTFCLCQITEN